MQYYYFFLAATAFTGGALADVYPAAVSSHFRYFVELTCVVFGSAAKAPMKSDSVRSIGASSASASARRAGVSVAATDERMEPTE